jgi:hypothetical protein
MAQEHTKGPWEYEAGEPVSCVYTKVDGKCTDIAYLSLPNHAANARLIAAAPDLLEALEAAVEWNGYDDYGIRSVWLKQALSAIAKAKGGAE